MIDDDDLPHNVTKLPRPQSLVEWFQEQKAQSGISEAMADTAGLQLYLDPKEIGVKGYLIPYYHRTGELSDYYRVRVFPACITAEGAEDYEAKAFGKIGKYWQPKGSGLTLYWPRVANVDHTLNLPDTVAPLFIVEGEKKALKLQVALLAIGVKGSVVGMPGAALGEDLRGDLSTIPLGGRAVFICFDWNARGTSEANTRKAESNLDTHLRKVGATPYVLRWPVTPEAGEQKVDDWLVAGGDLGAALRYSIDNDFGVGSELYSLQVMLNDHWAMLNGKYVRMSGPNRSLVLGKGQFLDETAEHFVLSPKGKRIQANAAWIQWESKRRVDGFCWEPPGLGEARRDLIDNKVNISPQWPPLPACPPWQDGWETRPEMIDRLLRNFCEADEHFVWLCQHIAHMLRHPGVTTTQVVHICGVGGTGKGLLQESLQRVMGSFMADVDLGRADDFNGELKGLVCAFYNEPSKFVGRVKDLESLLKKLAGSQEIIIREMRTDAYTVPNFLHIFITMNHHYTTHLDAHSRRDNYFKAKEAIKPVEEGGNGFGPEYWAFMQSPEFLPTWHAWALGVDLAGYSPTTLGPVSDARRLAIGLSEDLAEDFFGELHERMEEAGLSLVDIPTVTDLYSMKVGQRISGRRMTHLLAVNGFPHSARIYVGDAGVAVRSTLPLGDHSNPRHKVAIEAFKKAVQERKF